MLYNEQFGQHNIVQNPRPADNLRKYKKKQNPKNKVILQFKIWIKQDNQLRL